MKRKERVDKTEPPCGATGGQTSSTVHKIHKSDIQQFEVYDYSMTFLYFQGKNLSFKEQGE